MFFNPTPPYTRPYTLFKSECSRGVLTIEGIVSKFQGGGLIKGLLTSLLAPFFSGLLAVALDLLAVALLAIILALNLGAGSVILNRQE